MSGTILVMSIFRFISVKNISLLGAMCQDAYDYEAKETYSSGERPTYTIVANDLSVVTERGETFGKAYHGPNLPTPPLSAKKPVRCTRGLLLGIPVVHNVGNTRVLDVCAPRVLCNTHLKYASGILHFYSGSEAHGRLRLTDNSPPALDVSIPGCDYAQGATLTNMTWYAAVYADISGSKALMYTLQAYATHDLQCTNPDCSGHGTCNTARGG
eukprot:1191152-Prorocentrum_minimum.AAC.2